jgi:hypothetical protein
MASVRVIDVPEQVAFKVSEAARYLGISPNTLRKRSALGLIRARRDRNGDRVFLLRDLEEYLNSLPPDGGCGTPPSCRPAKTGRNTKGEEE